MTVGNSDEVRFKKILSQLSQSHHHKSQSHSADICVRHTSKMGGAWKNIFLIFKAKKKKGNLFKCPLEQTSQVAYNPRKMVNFRRLRKVKKHHFLFLSLSQPPNQARHRK